MPHGIIFSTRFDALYGEVIRKQERETFTDTTTEAVWPEEPLGKRSAIHYLTLDKQTLWMVGP